MTSSVVLERPAVELGAVDSGVVGPNVVKARGLHTVLSDVLHFAAPPAAMVPSLEAVRLEAWDGQLVAVAMDRCALGVSRVEYSGAALTIMVAVSDAKALAAMAKTGKRDEKWREVTVEVAADGTRATFRFNSGEAMTVGGLDVSYPNWRQMLPKSGERMGGIAGTGYEPSRLAKFTKVRAGEWGATVVAFPTVNAANRPGPTVVQVGADFVGLLMPKGADRDVWRYEPPGWLHTGATTAAAGAGPEVVR